MNRLLDWLERRIGRYAVPNLALILVFGQIAVFVIGLAQPAEVAGADTLFGKLQLVPAKVMEGEVWRLVTFPFALPTPRLGEATALPIIALVLYWLIFNMMGSALESVWGVFRFNAFLVIGYLATVVAAFAVARHVPTDNFFLYSSTFFAFARIFPDYVFRLYFLLPIKVKWLARLQWAMFALWFYVGDWPERGVIFAAVLNYFLFFWSDHVREFKMARRRRSFQAKTVAAAKRMVHECRVCGLTSTDAPRTAFRYCSQCADQTCYCPDHIRNHEHIVAR